MRAVGREVPSLGREKGRGKRRFKSSGRVLLSGYVSRKPMRLLELFPVEARSLQIVIAPDHCVFFKIDSESAVSLLTELWLHQ